MTVKGGLTARFTCAAKRSVAASGASAWWAAFPFIVVRFVPCKVSEIAERVAQSTLGWLARNCARAG